jgi:hypothetical protein
MCLTSSEPSLLRSFCRTDQHLPILDTAHNLLLQYEKLCNMNQRLIPIEERLLIFQFMETIRNNIAIIYKQVQLHFKISSPARTMCLLPQIVQKLSAIQSSLWQQLAFPHQTEVRSLTFNIIILLEQILSFSTTNRQSQRYYKPISKHTSNPSILDQIIYRPFSIVDPYILALQKNYYYPLMSESLTTIEVQKDQEQEPLKDQLMPDTPRADETPPQTTPDVITIEHSLEAITELIAEYRTNSRARTDRSDHSESLIIQA